MQEILLANPRRRRRSRRKMSAKQAMYFGGGKKRRRSRRRSVALSSGGRRSFRRSSRRIRHHARRAYSAGGAFSIRSITSDFGPAIMGAGGALVVDWIFGNIPLPATMTTGMMLPVTRLAAAIGVGALAGMALGRATGEKVAVGALVVTSYSIIKNFIQTNVPSLTLARFVPAGNLRGLPGNGMGYISPARPMARMQAQIAGPMNNPLGSHLSRYVRR